MHAGAGDSRTYPAARAPSAAYPAAVVAVLLLGLALRLWQYGAQASLWVDEAAIARNILDRGLVGLLAAPLDYGQYAPPGFLALVEVSEAVFGPGELSLRLTPFAAGVATVPLFFLLARRTLSNRAAIVATFLVATAAPLILFGANLKQYAVDVLAVVAIALLTHRTATARVDGVSAAALSSAGVLATLVSSGVVFMLVPAGAFLVWSAWWTRRRDWRQRMAVAGCWAVAAAAAVLWSDRHTTEVGRAYMNLYWARGFVPGELSRMPAWVWASCVNEFGGTGGPYSGTLKYPYAAPVVVLFALGALTTLWRRGRADIAILLGPIALVLLAAAVGAYPFRGRVILFLVPLLLILAVRGAEAVGRAVAGDRGDLAPLGFVPLAIYALIVSGLPQDPQQMRPVMDYVHRHRQPGDLVWVLYGAGPAFGYYRNMFPMEATVSICDRENPRSQIAQVDALRGASRAWVIVSHAGEDEATDERTPLVSYLDTIGQRLDTFPPNLRAETPPTASAAFLYKLDDPQRLAAASSATFPVSTVRRPAWGCYGSMTFDERRMPIAAQAVIAAAEN